MSRTERYGAPDAAARGRQSQPADASSQARKAHVRAALFSGPEPRSGFAPMRIGRFTLLECIGAGAMGEIYAAYDEQLDRKVALKLVRAGVNASTQANQRLLREAQTLAQLSHPNVVQVYEAGTYEGGVFIAMEFIRGKTLGAWLETTRKLPRRQRQREILRQLMAAGRGLEAAHQAGLAHRDFKPDNVLVGDDGRVRVVDFGLARAVAEDVAHAARAPEREAGAARGLVDALPATARDGVPIAITSGETLDDIPSDGSAPTVVLSSGELADASASGTDLRKAALRLTATGTIMGTPRFMAPEQMHGRAADHRSDQFSFCVTLFRAFYGEWPFAGESLLELIRTVGEGELVLPKDHAGVPAPIRKALLRGLSRDPADRFPDMGALLQALERWQQRRRRVLWAIAAAGVVVAGALAPAVASEAPAPCAQVTSEIDALWSTTRRDALAAAFADSGLPYASTVWRNTEAVIDAYVGTWRSGARDACEARLVRQTQSAELYDKRMLCLERGKQHLSALLASFASDVPAHGAENMADETAGKTMDHAVEAAASLPELAVCSDTETLVLGVAPPAQPAVRQAVSTVRARLAEARTHERLGRNDEALRIAEDQREAVEALPYPPVRAEVLHQLGRALSRRGTGEDVERAESLYFEALSIAEGTRHDRLAVAIWHDLAVLASRYHTSMKRGQAWSERERAAVQRTGNQPGDRARALRVLGALYHREGNYDEAADWKRQAIEILADQPHQGTQLASYYQSLADTETMRGNQETAASLYDRALRLSIEQLGDEHPAVARAQRHFAMMLVAADRYERARELLTSALATWEKMPDTAILQRSRAHLDLCDLEARAGTLDEARAHARQGRALHDRVLPPDHVYRAEPDMCLGLIAFRQRDFAAAREAYEAALARRRYHLGDHHRLVVWTWAFLAESLVEMDLHDEALAHVEEIGAVLDHGPRMNADFRGLLLGIRGRALLGLGHVGDAIDVLQQSVALLRARKDSAWERATALWALARALRAGGSDAGPRARALAEEARTIYGALGQGGALAVDAIIDWES